MRHIAAEHDAQIKAELEAAARRARLAKIRRICLSTLSVILLFVGFKNRAEIGRGVYFIVATHLGDSQKKREAETAEGDGEHNEKQIALKDARANFGGNLKAIRGVAAERDKLLDEFSGK